MSHARDAFHLCIPFNGTVSRSADFTYLRICIVRELVTDFAEGLD